MKDMNSFSDLSLGVHKKFHHNLSVSFLYSLSLYLISLLVCKSKNLGSWVYQLMIHFIVVSSFFLQDYISFIFFLVFCLFVFFSGVVVFLIFYKQLQEKKRQKTEGVQVIICLYFSISTSGIFFIIKA